MQPRLDYKKTDRSLLEALYGLNTAVDNCGLERSLLHLIKLRASQINVCSFCVDMHTHEARADGESEQRLYMVAAWKESPLFSERERAAFAWTESVTRIAEDGVGDDLFAAVRQQFSEDELAKLTIALGMIDTWNRICVSFHVVHPVRDRAKAA